MIQPLTINRLIEVLGQEPYRGPNAGPGSVPADAAALALELADMVRNERSLGDVRVLDLLLDGVEAQGAAVPMDDDEDGESRLCGACNGSGEGLHDGSRCSVCRGSGETTDGSDDDPSEMAIDRYSGDL